MSTILTQKPKTKSTSEPLPIKSAFFEPGSFMQNFGGMTAPHPTGDVIYAISNIIAPQTLLPLIEVVADTGKYLGVILAEPEKYESKVFSVAVKLQPLEDIIQMISNMTIVGITAVVVVLGYSVVYSANLTDKGIWLCAEESHEYSYKYRTSSLTVKEV